MPEISIRELKTHASAIIRQVKEKGMRYIITHRGRPTAVTLPMAEAQPAPDAEAHAWEELTALGEQISRG